MDTRNYILSRILSEDMLTPEIYGAYIHTFEKSYRMEAHEHSTMEVISVIHGSSYMVINNRYIKISKGECLVIFPDVSHSFFLTSSESCRLINVHFNPGRIADFFHMDNLQEDFRFFYELKTNTMSFVKLVDNNDIRSLSERIIRETERKGEFLDVLQRLYFCELYVRLSQILSDTQKMLSRPVSAFLSKAMEYIRNFYNEKLTLEQVAESAGVSVRHLTRLFSEGLGMTVQDYTSMLRLKKAKELLETTKLDIPGIAQACGYGTSQYFTTCFGRSESITPKKYRELVRGRILNRI
jgi:AraC family transcriptional regulator, melibiose operon regulatory protein